MASCLSTLLSWICQVPRIVEVSLTYVRIVDVDVQYEQWHYEHMRVVFSQVILRQSSGISILLINRSAM